ncbi:HAAS signaling domain-containing protein [Mangrovihabitans endophyticus]|uniref:Uncharacterized protein n=1 Tax=Mangrovihabitans endophyticus TaxID=1751298 RepID=A0A8J3FQ32_9ACTN|nr:DUF1700 domain-containing protein [Mangrovihabitans endophyticus]GGK94869.1 hypothetical protein GCM10012284_31150 [Mangrovihabitans endophyticus]
MTSNQTDLADEYLHEVELRLSGLPLLQRRELLAALKEHIAEAREHASSEGELVEVLERLGSPEEVAAAAYQEAGTQADARTPASSAQRTGRVARHEIVVMVVGGVVALLVLVSVLLLIQGRSTGHSVPARPAPSATR